MTKEQKKFLMVTLPKFILREQGRGFSMDDWLLTGDVGEIVTADGIDRKVPKCGTVACIGGSTQHLLKLEGMLEFDGEVGGALGLTLPEARGLFYKWEPGTLERYDEGSYAWPPKFAKKYKKAKTPLAKAKIVADLCKLVGKTEGKCLHR